jgi:hypothetical protein
LTLKEARSTLDGTPPDAGKEVLMPLVSLDRGSSLFTTLPSWSLAPPDPVIRREDIRWTGGANGVPLRIALAFENPSDRPSAEAIARVDVAPFGAFLDWSPLTRVTVPSVSPGKRRVLTATLAGDALPPPPALAAFSWASAVSRMSKMALDAHFVGNLNVFVSRAAPVERHVQRAVGLRPGRDNLALFCVGDGKADAYTFSIGSAEPGWDVEILGIAWGAPVQISSGVLALRIRPGPNAESGGVSVLVERGSTRQVVPVEFELDVAARSKCFFF